MQRVEIASTYRQFIHTVNHTIAWRHYHYRFLFSISFWPEKGFFGKKGSITTIFRNNANDDVGHWFLTKDCFRCSSGCYQNAFFQYFIAKWIVKSTRGIRRRVEHINYMKHIVCLRISLRSKDATLLLMTTLWWWSDRKCTFSDNDK